MQQYRFGNAPFRHGALKRVKRVVFFKFFAIRPRANRYGRGRRTGLECLRVVGFLTESRMPPYMSEGVVR